MGRVMILLTAAAVTVFPAGAPFRDQIAGTWTEITVSDHPTGVCEPWGAYTDFTITLESEEGFIRWVRTSISTPQIVGEGPCTKAGAFSLIVDPNVDYTACIDGVTAAPGAVDAVSFGTCGIRVPSEALKDGLLDITVDPRKTGSSEYWNAS